MTLLEFLFMNEQSGLAGGSTVEANPYVQALERQSALQQSYRQPGGGSYNQPPWTVTNNNIFLSQLDWGCFADGNAKHGCFHVTLSGTTAVTFTLLNLTTNATSSAGDTVFATVYALKFFNLGSLDGTTGGTITVAPAGSDPFTLGYGGTSPTHPIYKGGIYEWTNPAGVSVTSSVCQITVTPAAGGNFACVVSGA
jgi:hypothetical protein